MLDGREGEILLGALSLVVLFVREEEVILSWFMKGEQEWASERVGEKAFQREGGI